MKKYLWIIIALFIGISAQAQQQGIVRTLERPGKNSVGIPGVTINVMEYPNAVVSKKGGKFSFVLDGKRPGDSFTVTRVQKKGYTLVDKQLKGRRYAYSATVPIEIVMVADEQLEQDKKRIEDKAYNRAKSDYDKKVAALQEQLNKKSISEREYRAKYEELSNNYNNYVQLIDQMAERYATTDYTGMSDISRQIQECIENADLEQADKLISSKGDFDKREQELANKMELKEKSENLAKQLQEDIQKEAQDLVQDYYNKFAINAANYQNDSAAYYLERMIQYMPTDVEWLRYTAWFIFERLADYPRAEHYYHLALEQAKLQYGENNAIVRSLMTWLAYAYDHDNKPDTALVWLNKTLDLATLAEDADSSEIAMSYTLIGRAYLNKEDYDKGLEYTLKGLEIRERLAVKDTSELAQSYNNLGFVYHQLNDTVKALEYYLKALDLREQAYGEESSLAAFSHMNIGYFYYDLNDREKALEHLGKAYQVYHKKYGIAYPHTQTVIYYLGDIYLEQGDYDKALECFQECTKGLQQYYGTESTYAGNGLILIGRTYSLKGDTAQALEHYQQALSIYEKTPEIKDEKLTQLKEVIDQLKEKIRQEKRP